MGAKGLVFYGDASLKPCPFCGGQNLVFNKYLSDGWIECEDCEARGPVDCLAAVFLEKCEGNAVDSWNEREEKP